MNYDEISIGSIIPSLTVKASPVLSGMYCGVTWDFARLHYDKEYAARHGFPERVIDPQMLGGFMARMLSEWISDAGTIKKLTLRYRGAFFIGDTLQFAGNVTDKYAESGKKYLKCGLSVENQEGKRPVEGEAIILFHE